MNPQKTFWSFGSLKQPVNQWLCIGLVGLMCFWTVLYYVTQKAQIIGEQFSVENATEIFLK